MTREGPVGTASVANVAAWLDRRIEPAPPTLRDRLTRAVAASALDGELPVAAIAIRAGETLLHGLLLEGCSTRSAAPDLLAADALVTYAFEALAESPSESARALEASATESMLRIARLGAEP